MPSKLQTYMQMADEAQHTDVHRDEHVVRS